MGGRECNDMRGKKKIQTSKTKKPRTSYTAKTKNLAREFGYTFWWHLCPAANAVWSTEPIWCCPTTDYSKWDQSWNMKVVKKQTSTYSPKVSSPYLQDQLSTYDDIWNRHHFLLHSLWLTVFARIRELPDQAAWHRLVISWLQAPLDYKPQLQGVGNISFCIHL